MEQAETPPAQVGGAKSGAGRWVAAGLLTCAMGGPALWFGASALIADAPEIEACEKYVLGGLRSPSTYERISAESTRVNDQQWVSLVFDAANAYGAPVRDTEICKFRLEKGLVVVPHVTDPELAVALRRLDELSGLKREPCCLD